MRKNGKFFKRIMIGTLSISIVFCIALIGLFTYHQMKLIRQEQSEKEKITLNAYSEKFEKEAQQIFRYIDILCSESGVIKFASSDEISESDKIKLYNEIKRNRLIRGLPNANIIFYKPEYDCFITEDGVEHLSTVEKKYGDIPFLKSEINKYDSMLPLRIGGTYKDESKNENIVFFARKTVDFDYEVCFLIIFNKRVIENELQHIKMNSFYIKHNDVIVFQFGKQDEPVGNVWWKESNLIPEWKYGVKESELNLPTFFVLQLIVLCLGLSMVSFFSAKYISRKIYVPLKKIQDNFFKEDSAYDEFEIFEKNYLRLLEDNSKLNNQVEDYGGRLKSSFLLSVFKGSIEKEMIPSKKKEISLNIEGAPFCIAFILLPGKESADSISTVFKTFVNEVAKELLGEFFFIDAENAVVLFPKIIKHDVRRVIIEKATMFESNYDKRIQSVVLEQEFDNISSLYGLYPLFVYMCGEKLLSQEEFVIYKDYINMDSIDSNKYHYPIEMENKFISSVENGAREEAIILLRHVFKTNIEDKKLSPAEALEFKYALSATARRIAVACELNEFYEEKNLKNRIVSATLGEELIEILEEFYNIVLEKTNVQKQDRQTMLFEKIDSYVIENYCNMVEISAVNVAAKFNVSAGYIYKLYKKMKNKTFIEYVLELRVEKAKQLLRENPEMKIREVAETVGYLNPTSFMRLFKKVTGETPESYRSKREKGKSNEK